jgi:hypothetical protein
MDRDEYVEEHSRQYWGQRRDKVKNRIRHAILDFSLLFDHLEEDVRDDLSVRKKPNNSDQEYIDGVRDGLALLLEASGGHLFIGEYHEPPSNDTFWYIFEGAWERLMWHYAAMLNRVNLEVDSERIPWGELRERAKAGEELTVDEQAQLLLAFRDDVDPAETQRLLNALLFDEDEMPTTDGIYDPTKE